MNKRAATATTGRKARKVRLWVLAPPNNKQQQKLQQSCGLTQVTIKRFSCTERKYYRKILINWGVLLFWYMLNKNLGC